MKGYEHCYGHREDLAEERRRNAAKGGKSGGRGRIGGPAKLYSREISAVKDLMRELSREVLNGQRDRADAIAVGQLQNVLLRAIETERRLKEAVEFEESLEELERTVKSSEAHLRGRSA
ncbi:MAG: hypothetical protein ACRDTR_15955 [Rubrobacter sp.]